MAWPRIKNSRSSAQPGTHAQDGGQPNATPAPDAEPLPGSNDGAGVNGSTPAVTPGPPGARRPLRPIRYAHEGSGPGKAPTAPQPPANPSTSVISGAGTPVSPGVPPAASAPQEFHLQERAPLPRRIRSSRPLLNPAWAVTPRSAVARPAMPPGGRQPTRPTLPLEPDEQVGPVARAVPDPLAGAEVPAGSQWAAGAQWPAGAEVPAGAQRAPGAEKSAGAQRAAGAEVPAGAQWAPGAEVPAGAQSDAGAEAAAGAGPAAWAEPVGGVANEGLGIFGGVTTTEATDDPPARNSGRPARHRPPAGEPGGGPAGEAPRPAAPVIAIGSAWNQPAAQPAGDEERGEANKPGRLAAMLRGILHGGDPDDGEPRVSTRDLPPDIQVRFWRVRLIIMVIVGAVFAIVTRSWEIALTLAILAGIVDTVYRSRKAAHYQVASPHPGARKRTRGQLARMPREGYFTLNDRPIPGTGEVIDHLVVGPSGVYAIDSEKWDAKLPVRTQNHMKLYLGPQSQKDRLDHAAWEAGQASQILSEALGTEIPVRPALAIYGPQIPWDIATIRNVDVFTGGALRKYLKRRARPRGGGAQLSREPSVTLTREEVRTIYEAAQRVLPAPDDAASSDSTSMGAPAAR